MATRRLGGIATSSSVPDNGGDHSGGGGGGFDGYVDDVFSTYLYEGLSNSGVSIDQTIYNGVDLLNEGGLVWTKKRVSGFSDEHALIDTERGVLKELQSNSANPETDAHGRVQEFLSDGYVLGGSLRYNQEEKDFVSWTFRKAPSFFDVVTYSGQDGHTQAHNLDAVPGMIIVKCTTLGTKWLVWHRDLDGIGHLVLNENAVVDTSQFSGNAISNVTNTSFDLADWNVLSNVGQEYVAYLFAHDDSDESMIKCGSYTGNGNVDGPEIDLGFEPQWLLIKDADGVNDWFMLDTMRGIVTDGNSPYSRPNLSDAESSGFNSVHVTPTGFKIKNSAGLINDSGKTYIYMAIRRPNKPAEEFEPEELFTCVESTSDAPVYRTSPEWPVDFSFFRYVLSNRDTSAASRLTGPSYLQTNQANAEESLSAGDWDYMNGWRSSIPGPQHAWMWRRAPGFFDVVAYEGANSDLTVNHSLGVVPEMMWVKARSDPRNWTVLMPTIPLPGGSGDYILSYLDLPNEGYDRSYSSPTDYLASPPTDTAFEFIGNPDRSNAGVNYSNWEYIAYLWASVPGICDIGSYTGTVGDQDIDCGFTNGARFVLIKRTDAEGDWMYFDTLRGISASDSPMLTLNTTAAEASGSYIKPISSGFTVTSNLTGISGAEYIYMAIA